MPGRTMSRSRRPCHTHGVERDDERLNWGQVAAAAAAAMSAALLLSTLGVAGTVVGAAIGSVVASVATHTYSRGLQAGHRRSPADATVGRTAQDPAPQGPPAPDHAARRGLPWTRVIVGAIILFVGVMVVITAVELATGRAVSSYTGGSDEDTQSTIPGVGQQDATPTPTPSPTDTSTESPSETTTPTDGITPSDTSSPSLPESTTPTPTPESPTPVPESPTGTPVETAEQSPSPSSG